MSKKTAWGPCAKFGACSVCVCLYYVSMTNQQRHPPTHLSLGNLTFEKKSTTRTSRKCEAATTHAVVSSPALARRRRRRVAPRRPPWPTRSHTACHTRAHPRGYRAPPGTTSTSVSPTQRECTCNLANFPSRTCHRSSSPASLAASWDIPGRCVFD